MSGAEEKSLVPLGFHDVDDNDLLGAGMIGAVLGTIGGYAARTGLVAANGGRDRPVALGEDVVAVIAGVAVAYATSVL